MFIVLEPGSLDEIEREIFDMFGRENVERRWQHMSREIIGEVKRQMPVDTGTARASTSITIQGLDTKIDGVVYIKYLDEGHSSQAPAEFIGKIVEAEVNKFMDSWV